MKYDQKILIIRFSSIGDIILSTSPLKTIRNAYPNSHITFLTLDIFSSLLEYHPDIDSLLTLSKKSTFLEIWSFTKYLKNKNYELIFDLHNSLRSNLITTLSKGKIFQLKKPRFKRFLLFTFHFNTFPEDFSTLKMYHESLTLIWNSSKQIPKTYLSISKYEIKSGKDFLRNYGVKSSFIAIIPGAAWKQKQWKVDNYVQLISQLETSVVLLGSEKDQICFDIEKKISSVINLAGKTTLRQALNILESAEKIIGSDTGLTHAAEALGKNVSMILGPTSRETGAGTNLEKSINIEKDIWCRPCSQNGKKKCYRKSQVCMDLITTEDVLNSLRRV